MAIFNVATATEFHNALVNCTFGDEIVLKASAGPYDPLNANQSSFFLRNKGVCPPGKEIIIRSDVPPEWQLSPGFRAKHESAHVAFFAKIKGYGASNGRDLAAIHALQNSNGYKLKWLAFEPGFWGRGTQVLLGNNNSAQTEYSQVPYNFTVDQCYFRGDRLRGQRTALVIHADDVTVTNSTFFRINIQERIGNDSTCIYGVNCHGNWKIYNNELMGGTEPFITSGDDPFIRTAATFLSSTVNGGTISTTARMRPGEYVSILVKGGTDLRFRFINTFNTSTGAITFTEPLDVVPDVPGDIKWGIQIDGLEFRRNYVHRLVEWRKPNIEGKAPTAIASAGGTFVAGDYMFAAQPLAANAGNNNLDLQGSRPATRLTVAANQKVTLTWPASTDDAVTGYRVYRYQVNATGGTIAGTVFYFDTTATTFTFSGTDGTAGSLLAVDYWNLKNLFELKTGINVLISENVFENAWPGNGNGYAIWIKNNDQLKRHQFSRCDDVTFEWNMIRHVAGFYEFSGRRGGGDDPWVVPKSPQRHKIRNNLMYDSTADWWDGTAPWATTWHNAIQDCEFDHNTVIHHGRGFMNLGSANTVFGYLGNNKFRSNLFRKQTYGLCDIASGANTGLPVLDKWVRPDAVSPPNWVWTNNVVAGGIDYNAGTTAGKQGYPFGSGNHNIPVTTFENQFKNYAAGKPGNPLDLRVKRTSEGDDITSIFANAGHDGKDIGCDIPTLMTKIAGVIEGNPGGIDPPEPDPDPVVSDTVVELVTPDVTGNVNINFGFQSVAVIFVWQSALANGDGGNSALGIGVATGPNEQLADYYTYRDNINTSDAAAARVADACMISLSFAAVREMDVAFVGHTPTGCTINFKSLPSSPRRYWAIGIGGTGITAKCGVIQAKTTSGLQDYNIGLNNVTGLMFFAMVNNDGLPPTFDNKSMAGTIGFAAANGNGQAAVGWRLLNNATTALAWRQSTGDSCIYPIGNTGPNVAASLDSIVANGFRLDWTLANGFAEVFSYLAIAGPRTKVQSVSIPSATGNQSVVQGFRPILNLLLSAGVASNEIQTQDQRVTLGVATEKKEFFTWVGTKYAAGGPQIAKQHQKNDGVMFLGTEGNPVTQLAKASRNAILADGLRLNWSDINAQEVVHVFSIGSTPTGQRASMAATVEMSMLLEANLATSILMAADFLMELQLSAGLGQQEQMFRSIVEVYNLKISLDVKREVDSGTVNCLTSDPTGTLVTTNKVFKEIDSITLTAEASNFRQATYNDKQPSTFRVQLRDIAGSRVDGVVSWKVRGIV